MLRKRSSPGAGRIIVVWLAWLLAMPASTAGAFELRKSENGVVLLWPEREVVVLVDQSGAPPFDNLLPAVQAAFDSWAQAGVPIRVKVQLSTAESLVRGDGKNVIGWQRGGWKYAADVVAMTGSLHRASSGLITETDIALNGNMRWTTSAQPVPGMFDLQSVMAHEAGHFLGMAHAAEKPPSTMSPATRPGDISKRVLSDDDRAGALALRAEYRSREPWLFDGDDDPAQGDQAASDLSTSQMGCTVCEPGARGPLASTSSLGLLLLLAAIVSAARRRLTSRR